MTRRTWFRTITGALATLATGLGLRKVEYGKTRVLTANPDYVNSVNDWIRRGNYSDWKVLYSRAYFDGQRWHFEDVKPEELELDDGLKEAQA